MFRSMGGAAFSSLFKATEFAPLTSPSTETVPDGANAIHIKQAIGGGSGGVNGGTYDKSGGESAGAGGTSGAYVSDKIFYVNAGETITFTVGQGGVQSNTFNPDDNHFPNYIGDDGSDTTIVGSSSGNVAVLGGGNAGGSIGGSNTPNTGPLRTNYAGTGGTATLSASVTSGNFIEANGAISAISPSTASLQTGIIGIFNQSGDGVAQAIPPNGLNCGGDDCTISGQPGASSYDGNISGGTGNSGTPGTPGGTGAGGGGGGNPFSGGGNGGNGEIIYRYIKVL